MESKNKNICIIGDLGQSSYKSANRIIYAGGVLVRQSSQEITKSLSRYVLNTMPDGTCRTIKNQYFKNSIPNFISSGTFGATGVIEKVKNG